MNTRAITSPSLCIVLVPAMLLGSDLGNLFKCPFSNTHIYNGNIERFSIACAFCYNKQR